MLEKISDNKKQLGKNLLEFIVSLPIKTIYLSSIHYYIPTFVRKLTESEKPLTNYEPHSDIISPFTAITIDLYQIGFYAENPKYLSIPIITNIISGIYEYYREKKKIKMFSGKNNKPSENTFSTRKH